MVTSLSGGSHGLSIASMSQKQQQIFQSIDTNGDGKTDQAEMTDFQKSRQQRGDRRPR
jgi:hypothetical protein